MDMMYATLLLHSEKQAIDEENLKKVLTAAGATVDEVKIKSAVAALKGVDIEEAIRKAAVSATAAPVATEPAKEEKKEEDTEAKAEEAAAGLATLFG